ncbi:MAG: hypothetical protein OJF59_001354 [Cytophagales bacterium]|jgi:hypothetical protein|nr:MAG: hypothetical protein OJF59_001354 [Cytophagales bacterium]
MELNFIAVKWFRISLVKKLKKIAKLIPVASVTWPGNHANYISQAKLPFRSIRQFRKP